MSAPPVARAVSSSQDEEMAGWTVLSELTVSSAARMPRTMAFGRLSGWRSKMRRYAAAVTPRSVSPAPTAVAGAAAATTLRIHWLASVCAVVGSLFARSPACPETTAVAFPRSPAGTTTGGLGGGAAAAADVASPPREAAAAALAMAPMSSRPRALSCCMKAMQSKDNATRSRRPSAKEALSMPSTLSSSLRPTCVSPTVSKVQLHIKDRAPTNVSSTAYRSPTFASLSAAMSS
mmetsp:Transcript_17673/g.53891  ORF Transcript_17673/g.53891 Transcript_17673/m.53891 type:complete len:234 (+) Transcript_17673:1086-1787(+)